jgi:hypothetical protein
VYAGQGRFREHGGLWINDSRQRIILDLYSGGAILSESLCLAYDDGHRMSAPEHFLLCQWRL